MGHGPTILKAYLENSNADWIFQADADSEIEPKYFSDLWELKNNYDFILGKRTNRKSHFLRKIISLFSRLSIGLFYSNKIYDVNSPSG